MKKQNAEKIASSYNRAFASKGLSLIAEPREGRLFGRKDYSVAIYHPKHLYVVVNETIWNIISKYLYLDLEVMGNELVMNHTNLEGL